MLFCETNDYIELARKSTPCERWTRTRFPLAISASRNRPFGHHGCALISAGSLCLSAHCRTPCTWTRVKRYNNAREFEEAP